MRRPQVCSSRSASGRVAGGGQRSHVDLDERGDGERAAGSVVGMVRPLGLPFDPIERAGQTWEEHFGPAAAMRAATSVFRVQQILLARFDEALRPHDLTFARYEVLVLLTFSRTGELPLKVIGSRLMVHPTSVTNAIDRLVGGRATCGGGPTRTTGAACWPASPTRAARWSRRPRRR